MCLSTHNKHEYTVLAGMEGKIISIKIEKWKNRTRYMVILEQVTDDTPENWIFIMK
jgi:hypothetical protein